VQALANGTPIVITTLQKFPFIAETLDKLRKEDHPDIAISTKDKQFAVIVDEAHSSQSGESAMELKGVLSADRLQEEAAKYAAEHDLDEDDDADHLAGVVREMMKRGKQPNLSFFAFTATPKYKTLKVFDEPGPNGKSPFHLYTMRQAIEEKFILDVLRNYITYEAYFRLVQVGDDDPHVQRKKAARALARTLTLHSVNLRTKTEVMVEHFRTHVKHKIGGRAKAMVVTDGRLHAVRYKQAFDKYILEKGYTDVRTLVAFSGIVEDPDAKGEDLHGGRHERGYQGERAPGALRQSRISSAARSREISNRVRSTSLAHNVCGQEAYRLTGRADALSLEPNLPWQRGHLHSRFPQYAGRNL
jgi:type I restriction enzyme R subunit